MGKATRRSSGMNRKPPVIQAECDTWLSTTTTPKMTAIGKKICRKKPVVTRPDAAMAAKMYEIDFSSHPVTYTPKMQTRLTHFFKKNHKEEESSSCDRKTDPRPVMSGGVCPSSPMCSQSSVDSDLPHFISHTSTHDTVSGRHSGGSQTTHRNDIGVDYLDQCMNTRQDKENINLVDSDDSESRLKNMGLSQHVLQPLETNNFGSTSEKGTPSNSDVDIGCDTCKDKATCNKRKHSPVHKTGCKVVKSRASVILCDKPSKQPPKLWDVISIASSRSGSSELFSSESASHNDCTLRGKHSSSSVITFTDDTSYTQEIDTHSPARSPVDPFDPRLFQDTLQTENETGDSQLSEPEEGPIWGNGFDLNFDFHSQNAVTNTEKTEYGSLDSDTPFWSETLRNSDSQKYLL